MNAVQSFRHFGIVVSNLEKTQEFYQDVLHLRPVSKKEEAGPFIDTILGRNNITVTTVKMAAESRDVLLELLHFHEPAVRENTEKIFYKAGPTHVAFTVAGLPELIKKIASRGCEVISEPMLSPDGKCLVAFCRDYERNLLELVEPMKPKNG